MDANFDSYDAMSSYSSGHQFESSSNSIYDHQPKYEMRAPPRRRKDSDEQPLFLRKAYTMVTNCPAELGKST